MTAGELSATGAAPPLDAPVWIRLSCVAPLLRLAGASPVITTIAALMSASGGWFAGRALRHEADRPRALETDDPWGPSRPVSRSAPAVLRLTGWPSIDDRRWRAPAMVIAHADPRAVGTGVMLRGHGAAPGLWSRVGGLLSDAEPGRAVLPGSFDPARFLQGRGLNRDGRLNEPRLAETRGDALAGRAGLGLSSVRDAIISRLDTLFPPDEAHLLASVLLGRRGPEVRGLRGIYGAVGLGHLFAVSGLHVGLVAGVWLLLLRGLRAGPLARLLGLGAFLALYVLLVGLPGSALRAGGLLTAATLAAWAGRPHDGLRTLGLMLWLWALATPWALLDSGLRLSFGAAAGILGALRLAGPALRGWPTAPRWLGNALLVSLGAQIGALPETARSFGWIHPLATIFNLAAVPAFGAAVWLAAGALLCPWPWAAQAFAADAWLILRLISAAAARVAAGPDLRVGLPEWGVAAWLIYLASLVGFVLLLRGPSRRARVLGTATAALLLLLPGVGRRLPRGAMCAVQFDVGQGDCALFLFPDRSAVLIDTGEAWATSGPFLRDVRPWLRREGITRLSSVILTHRHDDHDGAADAVATALPVGRWWLGGRTEAPGCRAGVRPAPGDTLHRAGDWILICVADGPAEDENDRSLATALYEGPRLRGLWTGDLEIAGEGRLLASIPRWPESGIDVLKAGHHGSRTSSSTALLDAARPDRVLISCGIDNRHRHPSHGPFLARGETLRVLRTDLRGTIFVHWEGPGRPRLWTHAGPRAPRLDTPQDGG